MPKTTKKDQFSLDASELVSLRGKAVQWEGVYKRLSTYVITHNIHVDDGQSMLDALTADHQRLLNEVEALRRAAQHATINDEVPDAKR